LASLALAAVGLLVVQEGMRSSRWAVIFGSALLGLAGLVAASHIQPDPDQLLFIAFSLLASLGGVFFVVLRSPMHATLGFALTVLAICGLFFLQSAPFLAAATMMIYAGATIIIFLFVLMFAQRPTLEAYDLKLHAPRTAIIVATVWLAMIVRGLSLPDALPSAGKPDLLRPASNETTSVEPSRVVGLGRSMFTDYLWTVELAGTLLLVATLGAIAISQKMIPPTTVSNTTKMAREQR
jgi:NADH-quinone oxidoreductase subunit J